MPSVGLNPSAAEAFTVVISPGQTGVDLSTATSALFQVKRPDGTTTTWAGAMSAQSKTSLTVAHAYQPGDVAIAGTYQVYAVLTIPAGTVRSGSVQLVGADPFTM